MKRIDYEDNLHIYLSIKLSKGKIDEGFKTLIEIIRKN